MARFTDQIIGGQGPQAGDQVPAVVVMGADGKPAGGSPSSYTLLTNAGAGNGQPVTGVRGGDYIWQIEGTWAGATATLQRLGLDGTTWKNVRNAANSADATATADAQIGLGVGQGASVRVSVTGGDATTKLNSALSGLS